MVSVIVLNWNYARYLAAAVESALDQDYPHTEVLVVDDGSTDSSRALLERYRARASVIFQDNGGHTVAGHTGLRSSQGDIVMFLDSDDILYPTAVSRVVAAWRPGCAKVQFQLSLIDASGKRFGADPPWTVPLPSGDLVPQLHDTGRYQTPVTSGNAYPRKLLEQLFPVPSDFTFVDGYLNTVAPFYRPIISPTTNSVGTVGTIGITRHTPLALMRDGCVSGCSTSSSKSATSGPPLPVAVTAFRQACLCAILST